MDEQGNMIGKKLVVPVIILLEFVLLVVIVVMIVNNIRNNATSSYGQIDYDVEITNFRQEAQMLDKDGIKDVSFAIYDAVWLNTENSEKIGPIKATVREDSAMRRTFKVDKISQLYFIVDIPDLRQTYQVNRILSTKNGYNEKYPMEYRMMIYCPRESQKIYTEQVCRDRYAGRAEEIIESFGFE